MPIKEESFGFGMEEALESAAKKTVNVFQILTAGGCSYPNQKTCKYIYLLFSGGKKNS